jgi:proton-coupled amino acid transporter
LIDPVSFTDAIGFSVYSYEGIGVILPVGQLCAHPEDYKKIVMMVIVTVAVLYISFGMICTIAWGNEIQTPMITDQLPAKNPETDENPSDIWVSWAIKFLFSLNLVFSFPLVLYPAHIIIESNLYKGWPKSIKRQWSKNFTRTLLVSLITLLTIVLKEKLDKFLSLLGAVFCTPVAFILPAMFHYKACAETTKQKAIDIFFVCFGIIVLIFCSYLTLSSWNADD